VLDQIGVPFTDEQKKEALEALRDHPAPVQPAAIEVQAVEEF